ncbi:MAG: helix-turn-helix domain-containing protein [Planctomycetota bacterium]|jgi:AraC-like DNA-binding protein
MKRSRSKTTKTSGLLVSHVMLIEHKAKAAYYQNEGHDHIFHELVYLDYGKTAYQSSGKEFTIVAGEVILIPGNVKHAFKADAGIPFDFLNITFDGILPECIANKPFSLNNSEQRILAEIKEESQSDNALKDEMLLSLLSELLVKIYRKAVKNNTEETKVEAENRILHRSETVKRALSYLHSNYTTPLDAEKVARFAGASASHIRLLVRRETGINLSTHLRGIRIEAAKRLLRESPKNVDQTAFEVGYNSVPHFCRIFKLETGMTPSQFSKSLGIPDK